MSCYLSLTWLGLALLLGLGPSAQAETPRCDRQGDPLPRGAVARLGSVRLRHLDRVFDVTFSPDGKMLASCGADLRIRLWDAASGRPLRELAGHPQWISNIAFSPAGKILASKGDDHTVRLWNVATGREICSPIRTDTNFLAFSPDGKTLLFTNRWQPDPEKKTKPVGGIHFWDISTRRESLVFAAEIPFDSLAFAPDGRTFATTSFEEGEKPVIRLWNAATKRELWHIAGRPRAQWCLAFSPDGATLASGGGYWDEQRRPHGEIQLWDAATGKARRAFPALERIVEAIRFSPDGNYLASIGWAGPTILWDWKAADQPRRIWEEPGGGWSLAFSPDSRRLAWTAGQAVRIIDLPPRKNSALRGHTEAVPFVAFTPDGNSVISAGDTLRIWDVATSEERRTFPARFTDFSAAALRPDGRSLITASREGTFLWDLTGMKVLRSIASSHDYALDLALSPDGKTLLTAMQHEIARGEVRGRLQLGTRVNEDVLRLWDVETGREKRRLGKGAHYGHLSYSPDGRRAAAVRTSQDSIRIWDVERGTVLLDLAPEAGANLFQAASCFSPDGKRLAAGGWDGIVRLWGSHSGKRLHSLRGHWTTVRALTFSPDGKMLLSAGEDDTLRLWDVAGGKLLHELFGHRAAVLAAAFSPDGRRIASAGADTTILIWDVPGLSKLVRKAPPQLTEEELQGLWIDLIAEDGVTSPLIQRAMTRLAASPKESIAFVRKRLKPDLPREERVERWLSDLDSDVFAVRQNASRELAKMGQLIEAQLRRTLAEGPSLEKRRRVEGLLAAFSHPPRKRDNPWELTAEERQLFRIALVLERIHTPQALELLHYLAHATDLAEILNDPIRGQSPQTKQVKAALQRRGNGSAEPRP